MSIRRCAAVCGTAVVALIALSSCDKPTPMATVTVGTSSVSTEAACYGNGGTLSARQQKECTSTASGAKRNTAVVKLAVDDKAGIGVDKDIADKGWFLAVGGQAVTEVTRKTYLSGLAIGSLLKQQKSAVLQVVEGNPAKGTTYGVWNFKLEKSGS